ncbi:MAG: phage tail tape measure protein [Zunongwangia sp.]|uniref:phage tail tape measure protein n=1 Tax=Zunongwangia sp. TaxID=1965325 RepID=UPI003242C29D
MAVRGENSLFFESGIDLDGLKSGAVNATGIVQNLASTIGKISPFSILATGAATAFAKVGQEAYQMMREFEQAMKEVQTISQAAQKDFEGISSAVFALSKISPDPPAKLAKAYYQIVSAGYDGAEGLKLLEASTKAATAGVTSTEVAADGLTTVLNAFKLEAEDAEKVSDILFTTVRLGKTTIDELSHSLSEVAPLAASSGYNFEEVAAAIATLTKQGVPTSQAMTQIRAAIEATNEVLGDGAAQSMTLQNAFQAIYKEASGSQNKLKELTGRVEAMSAILAVSGENAEGAQKDLAEYAKAAGATTIANQRMLSSDQNQWAILNNRIKATTEEVGNAIVQISSNFAGFVNKALDDSDSLKDSFDQQRVEIVKLRDEIHRVKDGSDEFKKVRDQIIDQFPEFVAGIDKEKTSNEDLLIILDKVNDSYIERYKFQKRQEEIIKASQKQGDIEINLENVQDKFNDELAKLQVIAKDNGVNLNINFDQSNSDILKSVKEQLKDVEGAFDQQLNSGDKFAESLKGFAQESINNLSQTVIQQGKITDSLKEQSALVDELRDKDNRKSKEQLQTEQGRIQAIKEINKAMLASELDRFADSGVEEVEKALQERLKIVAQFRQIDAIEDVKSLKPFLDSNLDEIKEYAEKRKRYINTDFTKDDPDGTDPLKKIQKELKETELKYQNYFNLVRRGYDDLANSLYGNLLKQGDSFEQYLDRRIAAAQNAAEKEALILAKNNKESTLLTSQSLGYSDYQTNQSNNAKLKIDTKDLEKTLKQAGLSGSKGLLSEKDSKIITEPSRKEDQVNKKLIDALYSVTDGLYGVADLYYNVSGDEEGANRLAQFAGVAEGAGMIASGNIIGGAMKVLTSAISTEVESNTAVYEEAIAKLEKTIEKLDYTISQSVGEDRVGNRQQAILELEDLEEQAKKAQEAEKEAEKQVKVLGLTIAKKGKGSGTDQAKLEELEQKAEDARREVVELQKELNELFTGTTADSITDSIIQGFREGKRSIEDFAETFEDMMKTAMLNAFQMKYLEDEVAKFYEQFADYGEDGSFSAREIESLRELYASMINGARDDLNAIDNILSSTGMGSLYQPENRSGMSGAIKSITEDTAGVLEGHMNAMRIDTRELLINARAELALSQQGVVHLSEIASNTRYNRYLESIDNRMSVIENGLLQFQSRS